MSTIAENRHSGSQRADVTRLASRFDDLSGLVLMMTTSASRFSGALPRNWASKGTVGWVATGLFAVMMTLSGVLYLVGPRPIVEGLRELGYPPYFIKMLGVAKLCGVAALLVPRLSGVREWAYAGFTFDLIAAMASHLAIGDVSHVPPPLFALSVLMTSYVLRRQPVDHRPNATDVTFSPPPRSIAPSTRVHPSNHGSIWFGRIVLGAATLLLARISMGYMIDPMAAVVSHGITLGSAEAITMMRVVGSVFLGIALSLSACALSERRLLAGLGFLATVASTILVVRVLGAVVDGPAPFTMKVLKPEAALVVFSGVAFLLERRRRIAVTEHADAAVAPAGVSSGSTP